MDPDKKMLSDEVADYFERSILTMGKSKKNMIQVYSDTPVNEEIVNGKIRDYFHQKEEDIKHNLKTRYLKSAGLAIFGVIVLAIWFFLSANTDSVNLEVLSIIGWVAIWEATSIIIIQNQELRYEKKLYKRLFEAEINTIVNREMS